MKKNCGFALLLIFILCLTFCGCDLSKISPWSEKNTQNTAINQENNDKNQGGNGVAATYKIYVCGAVENEGYYEIVVGDSYLAAITQAGLLVQSWLPDNFSSIVDGRTLFVVVNYVENGKVKYCINANHEFIALRYPIDGLSDEVVNKIADYVEAHGAIPNKSVLRAVLGEDDYENYHYKLYIAEADYEEVH